MAAQANFVRIKVDRVEGAEEGTPPPRAHLLCVVRGLLKKIKQKVLVGDRVRIVGIDWADGRGGWRCRALVSVLCSAPFGLQRSGLCGWAHALPCHPPEVSSCHGFAVAGFGGRGIVACPRAGGAYYRSAIPGTLS